MSSLSGVQRSYWPQWGSSWIFRGRRGPWGASGALGPSEYMTGWREGFRPQQHKPASSWSHHHCTPRLRKYHGHRGAPILQASQKQCGFLPLRAGYSKGPGKCIFQKVHHVSKLCGESIHCEVKRTGLGPRKPKLRLNLLLSSVKFRGLLSRQIDTVIVKCSNHTGGSPSTSVWKWTQAIAGLVVMCPWWERYPTPSQKQTTPQPAVTLRKHKALLSFKYSRPTWTQGIY